MLKISVFFSLLLLALFLSINLLIPDLSMAQIKMKEFVPTATPKVAKPTPTPLPISNATPTATANPVATATQAPTSNSPTATNVPTDCSNVDIGKVVQDITESNLREYVMNLVDDEDISGHDELRSRASKSIGNRKEAGYIKSHYDKFGISNVLQTVPTASSDNIISSIKGKNEKEVYIVGGHYDSVTTAAADDNGSGTAVVMEVARAIKKSGFCPAFTLEFIDFTGEELGLYGSINYVKNIPMDKKIKGMINLDMVANPTQNQSCMKFVSAPYNPGSEISKKAVEVDAKYGIGLNAKSATGSVGASDHYPFEVKGHPAVFATECTFNSPVYHKPTDTSDKLDYKQLASTAKVVAATIIELSAK